MKGPLAAAIPNRLVSRLIPARPARFLDVARRTAALAGEFLSARSSIADLGLANSVQWRGDTIYLKCGGCHVVNADQFVIK